MNLKVSSDSITNLAYVVGGVLWIRQCAIVAVMTTATQSEQLCGCGMGLPKLEQAYNSDLRIADAQKPCHSTVLVWFWISESNMGYPAPSIMTSMIQWHYQLCLKFDTLYLYLAGARARARAHGQT